MRFLTLAVLLAGCAAAPARQGWEPERPAPAAAAIDLSAPPASDLADPGGGRPASASDYAPPPGGRLVATASGPQGARLSGSVALPLELWLPAAPPELRKAIREERASPDLLVDATMQADVDGDGRPELVVLARPAALFDAESPERAALLLALAGDGESYRLLTAHTFPPHFSRGRACHGQWTLAGSLRRGRVDVPLVFEERGVECGQLVGGGFDRAVWAVDLGKPGKDAAEAFVARARLGKGGAADLYEGSAWAADVDGDGMEELVTRGVSTGARPCGADPAFWVEELAYLARAPGQPTRAFRDGRFAAAAAGVLPPQLLVSHPAGCGTVHLPAAR